MVTRLWAAGAREHGVGRHGGNDDEVDLFRIDAGIRHGHARSFDAVLAGRHAGLDDASLLDARALRDPLIVGVDDFLEGVVGNDLLGEGHTGAGDPGGMKRPCRHGVLSRSGAQPGIRPSRHGSAWTVPKARHRFKDGLAPHVESFAAATPRAAWLCAKDCAAERESPVDRWGVSRRSEDPDRTVGVLEIHQRDQKRSED